ncbi:uncharacterized protein LOC133297350 [Gastrolobium bilobum]|uniref:uncharacterized protein LOC133297350 n=1 Tax=Gastrolobium bilobum TaxID=150636 RepID=UPI002AB30286|nr:uncharacterized protein LOC133297350 [Gastrolobium bilobum]
MELLYLLCSIVFTSLTSLILSLLLPFHALLRRWGPSRGASTYCNDVAGPISLYEGTVWHQRRHPVHHSFQYRVRYALFDLDRAPHAPPDHLSADEARQLTDTNGPILLLTIPPSVGYEQNPLNVYYCYAVEGSTRHLKKCIAEVTNTPWGERVSFIFNPHSDLVAKSLHVSPFMDMLGSWNIKASDPGENLTISISVHHPEHGNYFTASLKAKRLCSSSESDHAVFFWLMPHKVAVWIYWNAVKLWWKNVRFVQHPRYSIPTYREEALVRDQKLQCCGLSDDNVHLQQKGSDQGCLAEISSSNRWFRWRDAKWPWS